MKLPPYSVLMSVYHKEKPKYLKQCIDSILAQTIQTDDLVLVCDGPLNAELDVVIVEFQTKVSFLHVVRLEKNSGLGYALNAGLKQCRNEIVARMDTDDIAFPDRCEKQLAVFKSKNVDIVSAGVAEFTETPDVVNALRIPPETHEEIYAFAKKRNPFNHPCVMYRKSAVEAAGGYQHFYLLEDYFLWIRMLIDGSKGYNIQEHLLWMRAGSDMYIRRGGWKYAKTLCALFKYMKDQKFISTGNYIMSCVIHTASACAPNWLREGTFKKLLRK